MKSLTLSDFELLRSGSEVLSRDEYGEKVLRTPDGRIIKLFRRKRLLSSALLWPYAKRFARASRLLQARGIPSVIVTDVFRVPAIKRHAVVYPQLPGEVLRSVLEREPARAEALLERLAHVLAQLHERGVYFRAAHFGNFLVAQNDQLALIDISEARFSRGSLRTSLRARNFKPLISYPEDAASLRGFGIQRFLRHYAKAARLDADNQQRFLETVGRIHPIFRWSGDAPASLGAAIRGR